MLVHVILIILFFLFFSKALSRCTVLPAGDNIAEKPINLVFMFEFLTIDNGSIRK